MKLYIDTNIFLDHYLETGDYLRISKILNDEENIFLTSDKVILDVFYVGRKAVGKQKIFEYIEKIVYSCYIGGGKNINFRNILKQKNIGDFEDEFQIEIAKKLDADFIITNNKKDFKNSEITALTAKEFLEYDF